MGGALRPGEVSRRRAPGPGLGARPCRPELLHAVHPRPCRKCVPPSPSTPVCRRSAPAAAARIRPRGTGGSGGRRAAARFLARRLIGASSGRNSSSSTPWTSRPKSTRQELRSAAGTSRPGDEDTRTMRCVPADRRIGSGFASWPRATRPHRPTGGRPQDADARRRPVVTALHDALHDARVPGVEEPPAVVCHQGHRAVAELDAGERAAVAVGSARLDRQAVGAGAQQVGNLELVDRFAAPETAAGDLVAVQMHGVLQVGGDEQACRRLRRLVQLEIGEQQVGGRPARLGAGRLRPDPLRRAGRRQDAPAAGLQACSRQDGDQQGLPDAGDPPVPALAGPGPIGASSTRHERIGSEGDRRDGGARAGRPAPAPRPVHPRASPAPVPATAPGGLTGGAPRG